VEHDKLFGMPVWLVAVVLGAAGVTAYLLFFRKSGGGDNSPTGFSAQGLTVMANPDESATMAAQNQELSILAQQFGDFSTTLAGQGDQLTQLGTTVNSGFSSIGTSMNGLGGQITAGQNADQAYYQSLLANLSNYANSISSQLSADQQQTLATIQSDISQGKGTQAEINQLGSFLGWQWYQLPNRYTAFIPAGLNPPGWQ
jgi:hypothetical protein